MSRAVPVPPPVVGPSAVPPAVQGAPPPVVQAPAGAAHVNPAPLAGPAPAPLASARTIERMGSGSLEGGQPTVVGIGARVLPGMPKAAPPPGWGYDPQPRPAAPAPIQTETQDPVPKFEYRDGDKWLVFGSSERLLSKKIKYEIIKAGQGQGETLILTYRMKHTTVDELIRIYTWCF